MPGRRARSEKQEPSTRTQNTKKYKPVRITIGAALIRLASSQRLRLALQTCLLVALALHAVPRAYADALRPSTLSFYTGQGVDSDLLQLPGKVLGGSLRYESSRFIGLGYQRDVRTPQSLRGVFRFLRVGAPTTAIEVVAVQHWGMQNNFELNVAYALRTPYARLGPIRTRFGVSLGLSQAFGTPSFEDGPIDDPDRRYRLQNYNAYEFEWTVRDDTPMSLVTRIHHRSGVYGLIAPRRVGSNFVTAGIRYHW
jgi:hypothetical protein